MDVYECHRPENGFVVCLAQGHPPHGSFTSGSGGASATAAVELAPGEACSDAGASGLDSARVHVGTGETQYSSPCVGPLPSRMVKEDTVSKDPRGAWAMACSGTGKRGVGSRYTGEDAAPGLPR